MTCDTTTTTCYPCSNPVSCECPKGTVDAQCVQYTGDDLDNIEVTTGMYLEEILQHLNDFIFTETDFTANSTDSIIGTPGGGHGHSPTYDVRIDPAGIITVGPLGLMADGDLVGDGKVKVNAGDPKDYLEDQLAPANDTHNIITITPTSIGGVIYPIPTVNIVNLLQYISDNYHELLCEIVQNCVPSSTTTTSTTSTSTTSTSSTTTTSTTTTTHGLSGFDLNNNSDIADPFSIYFFDEVSFINYVVDLTTGDNQSASYTYNGSASESTVNIQHSTLVSVHLELIVNGDVIFDATVTNIGTLTFNNIDPYADVVVNLTSAASATTTTSTTTTSTSSTTTTTSPTGCTSYTITNNTLVGQRVTYIDCDTGNTPDFYLGRSSSITVCADNGSVDASDCSVVVNGPCS